MLDQTNSMTTNAKARAAIAGGSVLILQSILAVLVHPADKFAGTVADYFADGLFAVGLVLTIPGLLSLRERLGGTLSSVGGALACAGQGAVLLAVLATLAEGREALDLLYIIGFAIWMLGLLTLSVAATRQRSTRLLVTILLAPATIATLALFADGGAFALGSLWIIIASRVRRSASSATATRVAASATTAMVLLAVAGNGSSLQAQEANATQTDSPSTGQLVFISRDLKSTQIDRPPKGKDNPGDEFVGTQVLLDSTKKKVGRSQVVCFAVSQTDSQCSATFFMPDGTLEALGDPAGGTGPQFTIPIVGGTGTHAGARGTVTVTTRKGNSTVTFSLLTG